MSDRPTLALGFDAEFDVADWSRRYELGEVPSRLPYGLDGLDGLGEVHLEQLRVPGAVARARSRILHARAGAGDGDGRIGITWDENSAARSLLTTRHAARLSGVIWLTDLAERGSDAVPSLRRLLRQLDGLWVLSRAQLEPLTDLLGPDAPPVRFVRFGIDDAFFAAHPYPDRPLVMSAGRDRDRDNETLFAALAIVHRARPDAELVLLGVPPGDAPDGVRTVGHVPHTEVRALYRRASVVALATRHNLHVSGMTVALEAQSIGRPVVATRTPGFDDYLLDGVTGSLVPASDPQALAESILGHLEDPDAAAAAGRAGSAFVAERHTTRELCGAISEVVRESLGHPRRVD